MSFQVETDIEREFVVNAPLEDVFSLLADVPRSASHFPNVDRLVPLGDNAYRWEMRKIGVQSYAIQTIYACKYTADPNKGTIRWTPIAKEGNAQVKGQWTIKNAADGGTQIRLKTHGILEIPLPSLTKMLVGPIVVREFHRMVDQYIENLKETFEKKGKKKSKKA